MRSSIKSDFLQMGSSIKRKSIRSSPPNINTEINHSELVEPEYIFGGVISKHTFDNWPMAQQLEYIKHFESKNQDISFQADRLLSAIENIGVGGIGGMGGGFGDQSNYFGYLDQYGDRYNQFGALTVSAEQLFWEMNPAIAIQIATENITASDLLTQQVQLEEENNIMAVHLDNYVDKELSKNIETEHVVGGDDAPTSPNQIKQAGMFSSISPMMLVIAGGVLLFGFVRK